MQNHFKKGQTIVNGESKRIVLETLGDLMFVSVRQDQHTKYWETISNSDPLHFQELLREGWRVEGEEKEEWPKDGSVVYQFTSSGEVKGFMYSKFETFHEEIRDGLGCYRTEALARAAFEELRQIVQDKRK